MTTTLNAASMPLQGRHLIEASAGTGKTFTVANLYLRLLIDEQHNQPPTVENILVVTFTNAATEELRARLRSRIAVALQVLDGESPEGADPTMHDVLTPHSGLPLTRARLELAYQCMDQAAIFTIHGFCDRVLREQAFESGELFDAELQADVDALKQQAAQVWWRGSVTPLSAAETESIPKGWRAPSAMLNRLAPVLADPLAEIVPQFTAEQVQQVKANYEAAWQTFRKDWNAAGEAWSEQILTGVQGKIINKAGGKYTEETVDQAQRLAAQLVQQEGTPVVIDGILSIFSNSVIADSTRKGKEAPQSALGECIDSLLTAFNRWHLQNLVALQNEAKEKIRSEISMRKLLARQRTFDDLLLQLHAVLHSDNGDRLTSLLRSRYPVALIDEFQDTDRIQYEIFDRLFPTDEDSSSALYLIGDPKQSIYRFRGADIGIYLRVRKSANAQHSLDHNWRSSSALISALNTLYAGSDRPFGSADIEYQYVTTGGKAEGRELTVAGDKLPPLQFDCIDVTEDKLPNIGESQSALAQRCAQRVVWLLTAGNATLGGSPVQANDIAILVWTHAHANAVRQALLAVGVVSAMQSRESVFQSAEALDLLALLRVLAKPGDSTSLSRVLVSPLAGYSAQTLLQQREDAVAWQHIEDAVQRCRDQCRTAGPQAAVLRFMALFNTRIRALGTEAATARGLDRILGNYLHLADVLQAAWQDQPELPALIKTAQRWREQGSDEALQLRLESDEALVQIITVHKSKGLQYPIVMLPFACMGRDPAAKGDAIAYSEDGKPRLDVGSEQLTARQSQALQAQQDESLRALYVALTRAEQSCWIGVTANKNAKHAPLWQLLGLLIQGGTKTADCQPPIQDALAKLINSCTHIALSKSLPVQNPLSTIQVTDETRRARKASRTVQSSWRVGSYTALSRGATHGNEQPDHDAVDIPVNRPEKIDYDSPFHFPRGAEPGTLIHAVFEHLDFRHTDEKYLPQYAGKKLRDYGVDTRWTKALCLLVRNTLDTPLNENGFSLAALDKKDRLDELAFHFPVEALQADKLVAVLREYHVLGAEDDLVFDRLDGYMTGFIDLTFRHRGRWYIADYKSNHLGYETADYTPDALNEAMQHHRYDLQYLIYAVALRRYLKTRNPDFDSSSDFGGVYYLFVRGMPGNADAGNPTGVYAARPPEELLEALDQLLIKDIDHA